MFSNFPPFSMYLYLEKWYKIRCKFAEKTNKLLKYPFPTSRINVHVQAWFIFKLKCASCEHMFSLRSIAIMLAIYWTITLTFFLCPLFYLILTTKDRFTNPILQKRKGKLIEIMSSAHGHLGKKRQSQDLSPCSQPPPPINYIDMHIDTLIKARHKIPLRTECSFVLKN